MRFALASDLENVPRLVGERGLTIGSPLHALREVGSTNDEAKHAARAGAPHGSLWIAESQTAGRGRQGRNWISSPGENLLFSVLMRIPCSAKRLPPLSLVAGLAIVNAVKSAVENTEAVGMKWPNDVFLSGKKVAGVLVETLMSGPSAQALIVGIGLNVHTRTFPPEIAESATSVALHSRLPPDRAKILVEVLANLDRDLFLAAGKGFSVFQARMADADILRGQRVSTEGGHGIAEGVDDDGRLLVRAPEGELLRWNAGEVHVHPAEVRFGH